MKITKGDLHTLKFNHKDLAVYHVHNNLNIYNMKGEKMGETLDFALQQEMTDIKKFRKKYYQDIDLESKSFISALDEARTKLQTNPFVSELKEENKKFDFLLNGVTDPVEAFVFKRKTNEKFALHIEAHIAKHVMRYVFMTNFKKK